VRDATGLALPLEIRAGGAYFFEVRGAASLPLTITYEMRLSRPLEPMQYALASSLGPEAGYLMLADLLPRICTGNAPDCIDAGGGVRLEIVPPDGWRVATTEPGDGHHFQVADLNQAVFFLGPLRAERLEAGGMELEVALAGRWDFDDALLFRLAATISRTQSRMIGGAERGPVLVTLAPFPLPLTGLRSTALTRGRTVILLLNPAPEPPRTWAHLQRHLAHEMFHIYLPNAFRIRENFDWFWEGFTRYFALVTLLEANLATRDDYLAALDEEYDVYAANPLRAKVSLIAASPEKFANAASYELVYRKGMLVAALYDLELRWQTRNRRSLSDVCRDLYQNYARSGREVGNREVIAELGQEGNFTAFIADYIEGTRELDLARLLEPYGLIVERPPGRARPRLAVASRLNDRQRALVDQFNGQAAR
jgi:predicted metalloprotease with PDZ domain